MNDLLQPLSGDPPIVPQELRNEREVTDVELRKVLSDDQFKQYQELRREERPSRGGEGSRRGEQ
jgi:hypothetical protein